MSHFRRVCICGKVISQCRCIGDKIEEIVYNCVHEYSSTYVTTASKASTDPISLNGLREIMEAFQNEFRDVPNVLRVHPSTYNAMRECSMKKELEEEMAGVAKRPELTPYQLLLGVPIVIDNDINPGEWKLERVLKHDV